MVHYLNLIPLLHLLPAEVKREVGNTLQREAITYMNMENFTMFDRSTFVYAIDIALNKMPVFSVYNDKALSNMVSHLVAICFDEAVQRSIKIDSVTHV